MRATLAVILAMGSPLAGGTLQMAHGRLAPFRIVLNILGLLSPASVFAPPRS